MSPTIVNSNEVPADSDFDLQKWLKEIEGAENLMTEVEAKADNLQAKVDALLLEVGQPLDNKQDVIMSESNQTQDKSTEDRQ
jgi:hypothetical protein